MPKGERVFAVRQRRKSAAILRQRAWAKDSILRDGKSMRSTLNFQNLKAFSKCMFRILAALCFCLVFMTVGSLLLIQNTETLRVALSENTMRAIRGFLKIVFHTASVYQSLEILLTVFFLVFIVVSLFTCICFAVAYIIIFFMNIGAKRRATEEKHTLHFREAVVTKYERVFLLFGRIRV